MIRKAFVLAAGLGTRLRPLTDQLPKPLIPVGRKPLITFAFDHLMADAGVTEFIVNTHHLAGAYAAAFPEASYRGCPVQLRHEPTLLDTGGGIKNIADLLGPSPETFIVYNGDILTDLPIQPALEHHRASGNEVTLVLRAGQGPKHLSWDPTNGRVLDIRNRLGTGAPPSYAFSCVYLVEPAFLDRIPAGEVISVIPIFLDMIRHGGALGGVLIDEGDWRDLGTRGEYLRVHRDLHANRDAPVFPRYGPPDEQWLDWIDPGASVAPDARVLGASVLGQGASVAAGALIEDSILWPGAKITSNVRLKNCIVRAAQTVSGDAVDEDF